MVEMIWPAKIKEGEKVENNFGYAETIYLIEPANDGAKYITTSYFSRFDRKCEIHSAYFVDGEKITKVGIWKKDLAKVLNLFLEEEIKEKFKEELFQVN
ncbi:MAG: hypothetical protein Q8O84_05140 [Nanoarchaeota archaeon]|nr:hypothetical protein [Nanoarchaeota archaeon]